MKSLWQFVSCYSKRLDAVLLTSGPQSSEFIVQHLDKHRGGSLFQFNRKKTAALAVVKLNVWQITAKWTSLFFSLISVVYVGSDDNNRIWHIPCNTVVISKNKCMITKNGALKPGFPFSLRHFGHCSVVVSKLVVTIFTNLLFQTLWPNWLNFFRSFEKNSVYHRKMTEKINPGRNRKLCPVNFLDRYPDWQTTRGA